LFTQLTPSDGEDIHRLEGVGVVVAQHPPAAGQGLLVELAGAVQVA
jgi:hypothetical protein